MSFPRGPDAGTTQPAFFLKASNQFDAKRFPLLSLRKIKVERCGLNDYWPATVRGGLC